MNKRFSTLVAAFAAIATVSYAQFYLPDLG